jgi:hypothetical protein
MRGQTRRVRGSRAQAREPSSFAWLRRRPMTALCGLSAVLALVLSVPPAVAATAAVQHEGDCTEISVAVPVAAADVLPFVADEFKSLVFQTPSGHAVVLDGAGLCRNVSVDGEAAPEFIFSELLLLLTDGPPGHESDGGSDLYYIRSASTSERIHSRLNGLGLGQTHVLVKDMTFGLKTGIDDLGGPITEARHTVKSYAPWGFPYSLTLTALDVPTETHSPGGCCSWSVGSRGFVKSRFDLFGETAAAGRGKVESDAGSSMTRIIGGTSRDVEGVLRRFHYEATID